MHSRISFPTLYNIIMVFWAVQTGIMALGFVLLPLSNDLGTSVVLFSMYLDFGVFILMLVWALLEIWRAIDGREIRSTLGFFLVTIGSFVFLSAASAYRAIAKFIPSNPISNFFVQEYGLDDTAPPDQVFDFSAFSNMADGVIIASSGLFILSIGLAMVVNRRLSRYLLVFYGILNFGLTLTVLFALVKVYPSFPLLLAFVWKEFSSSTEE